MQLIIISGPSGSGKTMLSKIIKKKFKNGIILNTDNYYKTGLISQILSKIVSCYFDRKISFNFKLFKEHLDFILKKGCSNFSYIYDFKNKSIEKINKKTTNIKFIIVEGIFVHEILKSYAIKNYILINLKTKKKSCMKRVLKRDFIERGKSEEFAKRDFLKAWGVFHKSKKRRDFKNFLKKFVVENKSDIKNLLKKLNL